MVSTATPEAELQELDLSDLDDDFALFMLIENFNSPHCEAQHGNIDAFPCTHQPVARFTALHQNRDRYPMVCQNTVKYVTQCWEQKRTCEECKNPTTECWQLHPLNLGA